MNYTTNASQTDYETQTNTDATKELQCHCIIKLNIILMDNI